VPHTPHRPFVPERTPAAPRKATGPGAFRLARPFVHGAERNQPIANRTSAAQAPHSSPSVRSAPPPLPLVYEPPVEARPAGNDATQARSLDTLSASTVFAAPESLAPIEKYLQTEPEYARDASSFEGSSYELPPVEHFMDGFPEEAGIAAGDNGELMTLQAALQETDANAEAPEWGDTDWLQYDWQSAAALGEGADSAASSAWSETEWENAPAPMREIRQTAAKAIADALDGIARRIRDGELVIPSPGSVPDPAAIAATLAALLGVKR
jgi:hypothetical protein